jgi:cyclopropane-fatty-acyl-phospholipid synthase
MPVLSPPWKTRDRRAARSRLTEAAAPEAGAALRPAPWTNWFRHGVLRSLARLQEGRLELCERDAVAAYGGHDRGSCGELTARLRVHAAPFYRRLALGGSLGAAESYLDGQWDCDDLTALFRILLRNESAMNELDRGWSRLAAACARQGHRLRRNTRRGSRRNIAAHYDLGNDFFALFLDPGMTYSSGFFANEHATLEQAQHAKYDRLCRRLQLSPADHLLEIGSGWGGLAEHAARHYGCRVTTATISAEQHRFAADRIAAAGLADRVAVLQRDYRDLDGRYDKLISIEMIEAVGHEFLPQYFRVCRRLLKPGGLFALQAITMPDDRYAQYRRGVDFIQRYVFPGGMLPSLGALADAASRQARFQWLRLEDLAPHYARTLACWRENFNARLGAIRELGTPERLIRIWQYYFAYCEAAFLERAAGVSQIVLQRPR